MSQGPLLRVQQSPIATEVGREIAVPPEGLTIGREPGNSLLLGDPLLSRRHAQIRATPQGPLLVDLGGANGTEVNDARVQQHALAHGDRIKFGGTLLVYEAQAAAAAPQPVTPQTAAPQPVAPQPVAPQPVAPQPAAPQPAVPPVVARQTRVGLILALIMIPTVLIVGGSVAVYYYAFRGEAATGTDPETGSETQSATATGTPKGTRSGSAPGIERPLMVNHTPSIRAALKFRHQAARSWSAAVKASATKEARARLDALGAAVWPRGLEARGWGYLLETSILCAGARQGDEVPIAFYHPWSDVFFVTVWRPEAGISRQLLDAELLTGAFVRSRGQPRHDSGPPAAYRKLYPPHAVGLWAAQTAQAFDATFRQVRRGASTWRELLPALKDDALLKESRASARLQLAANMAGLGSLLRKEIEEPQRRQVREVLRVTMHEIKTGNARPILELAAATPPATRSALQQLPPPAWERFKPVSYVHGQHSSLLLLALADQTDRFLCMRVRRQPPARLEAVELYSFQAFYREREALRRELGVTP